MHTEVHANLWIWDRLRLLLLCSVPWPWAKKAPQLRLLSFPRMEALAPSLPSQPNQNRPKRGNVASLGLRTRKAHCRPSLLWASAQPQVKNISAPAFFSKIPPRSADKRRTRNPPEPDRLSESRRKTGLGVCVCSEITLPTPTHSHQSQYTERRCLSRTKPRAPGIEPRLKLLSR